MIADELGASDNKAIQMAKFTLQYKKSKEWIKNYMKAKLDNLS